MFVAVTRLRLRSIRYLPQFSWMALRSNLQARRAPGNLKSRYLNHSPLVFWTLSGWESEGAMRNFMTSGAHRRAMPKLLDWCDEASIGHWHEDSGELPDWEEAHRRMVAEGRTSKVHHPSADHQAKRIPGPKLRGKERN